jgi:hypothetical protein
MIAAGLMTAVNLRKDKNDEWEGTRNREDFVNEERYRLVHVLMPSPPLRQQAVE